MILGTGNRIIETGNGFFLLLPDLRSKNFFNQSCSSRLENSTNRKWNYFLLHVNPRSKKNVVISKALNAIISLTSAHMIKKLPDLL